LLFISVVCLGIEIESLNSSEGIGLYRPILKGDQRLFACAVITFLRPPYQSCVRKRDLGWKAKPANEPNKYTPCHDKQDVKSYAINFETITGRYKLPARPIRNAMIV